MRKRDSVTVMVIAGLMSLSQTGCATYRTISVATHETPKVYSGTRLDLNAIEHDEVGMLKFKVDPPTNPRIDLPFSIVLDTVILPLTMPVAAYEVVFP